MPRFPRLASILALSGALAGLLGAALPAASQELITPRTKDRKYPQGVFCPIPIEGTFTANGPSAIIRFSTNVFYYSQNQQGLVWTEQYLDNLSVAPLAVYQDHLGPPGSYSSDCYFGETIPERFYFQDVTGPLPLLETFDTGAPGWDVTQGAYWTNAVTAPSDPGTETDFGGSGALGLGQNSATPSASDSAVTSVVVSGLTSGQTYVVSGWWDVRDMELDQIHLTLRIYGNGAVPIAQRSWGGLKRRYR